METLDKWFWQVSNSPVGSLLLLVLVFLTRVVIDQYDRRMAARRERQKRRKAA